MKGIRLLKLLFGLYLLTMMQAVFASTIQQQLHIHITYLQEADSWQVEYQLPSAVESIEFRRRSNFDRSQIYQIDQAKFVWQKEGAVLGIRRVDGSKFDSLKLTFKSHYKFILKDYTQNIKYTDGSVMLYTDHLSLASDQQSVFHFDAANQNITFLGKTYFEQAVWHSNLQDGTYIYVGSLKPIENQYMLAIVDPGMPDWVWQQTQQNFPKLFNFYTDKTGQKLNFKPIVYFNYDQTQGDYANYSGGTLEGLVQLSLTGKNWQDENNDLYNALFEFLAHEAAHFWNGQMFKFADHQHAWMHEGGADAFAYLAMEHFALLTSEQVRQLFEDDANECLLKKGAEALVQSSELGLYRNYYSCGAVMAFASHLALQAHDNQLSLFDLWRGIFNKNLADKTYNHEDYFEVLTQLTGSDNLAAKLRVFSQQPNLGNQQAVIELFRQTKVNALVSSDYPDATRKYWGAKSIANLMRMHCNGSVSYSTYNDYIESLPIRGCQQFQQTMEIRFIAGIDIYADGIQAYQYAQQQCANKQAVLLQDRNKNSLVNMPCSSEMSDVVPYLKLAL
ncbi:hypothetical protein ACMZOO_08375 [Catenovulum sp. SX2]|uniref:hypothetical protein n=1 Tax=Catenovulum sp. SX2 TaxID=3398614 RepID=UPI003F825B31